METPRSPARPARLHPFAALRLAPGRIGDDATNRVFARPYSEVAARMDTWLQHGDLTCDPSPALYLHEYTAQSITVRGLVGALDLTTRSTGDAESAVLPHEAIHVDQAEDLARRMHGTGLNPAPILLVHRGPAVLRRLYADVTRRDPDHDLTDRAGQHHRIWAMTDPHQLEVIRAAVAESTLLIADGHHRYAAYLRLQEQHPGSGWDHGLVMVVDQDDTPLFLGAIHRVLGGTTLAHLATASEEAGLKVTYSDEQSALARLSPQTWVATNGTRWITLRPARTDRTAVELLHELVLPQLPTPPAIGYHHSVVEARAHARPEAVAVLLPAPDFDVVDRTLHAHRLLPEKATSFQPKPSVGVIMRQAHDAPDGR